MEANVNDEVVQVLVSAKAAIQALSDAFQAQIDKDVADVSAKQQQITDDQADIDTNQGHVDGAVKAIASLDAAIASLGGTP